MADKSTYLGLNLHTGSDNPGDYTLLRDNFQTLDTNANSVTSQLADNATSIGISVVKYPRVGNETDDLPRFQRAIDYLKSIGGGKLVVPRTSADYVFNATNPTINTPTRVLITSNNIHIEGIGLPTIQMTGIDKTYIDSINDYNSSGRDVFTAFSFMGVDNVSVRGIKFTGTWDGTGTFRYQSPRAKAVGFVGCTNVRAENLYGFNLLGNLVNATPSQSFDAGIVSGITIQDTTGIKVVNCHADHCLENGINYMGGTHDGIVTGCSAKYCGSAGFESATDNMVISNNIFTNNKFGGISNSGRDVVIDSNVCRANGDGSGSTQGNGITITYWSGLPTSRLKITNNIIHENDGFGIQVYAGVAKITVDGNDISNNSKANVNKQGIYLTGSVSSLIQDIDIINNTLIDEVGNTNYFVIISYADHVRINNNRCTMVSGNIAYAQGTASNVIISNNKTNAVPTISGSAIDCYQYNNIGSTTVKTVELSAVPTTGTWKQGDMIINPSTTASGSVGGWRCITSGTFISNVAWVASTAYTLGTYVNANSKVYRCTVAGTSGSIAPSHTSGTATDGTVTWSFVGTFATPVFKPLGYLKEGNSGVINYNGDGTTTSKVIAHGLSVAPTYWQVTPSTPDAGTAGIKYVTADATNLTVNFNTAPASGTANVTLRWKAEV